MNAKYEVIFFNESSLKQEKECGIAYGEDYGDIVNNISAYYGKHNIYSITIRLPEEYDSLVLPQDTIESILALKDDITGDD